MTVVSMQDEEEKVWQEIYLDANAHELLHVHPSQFICDFESDSIAIKNHQELSSRYNGNIGVWTT